MKYLNLKNNKIFSTASMKAGRKIKLIRGLGSLVAMTVLLSSCSTSTSASPSNSSTAPKSVVVAQAFQSLLYLPLYVGIDKGFFAKNGLNVTKVTSNTGSNAVASVISGSAQFSLQDPMIAMLSDIKGASIVPVDAVVNGVPVWIVGHKKQPLSSLSGKTIATAAPPSTSTYLLKRLLKNKSVAASLEYVPLGSEFAPVQAGQANFAALYEPTVEQAIAQGLHIDYSFAKQYKGNYAFSSIDTSRKFIKSNPKTVQDFTDGIAQSLNYIKKNPKGAVAVAVKEFPSLSPKVVKAGVDRMIKDQVYATTPLITKSAFTNALALQEFLKNLTPGQVHYSSAVNTTFATKAP